MTITETTAEVEANLATASRELGMLRQIQPNLRDIPARHNEARIKEKEDVVETLSWHLNFLQYHA